MRIDDVVYFAPATDSAKGVRFEDLDWNVDSERCALPQQLRQRFEAYYLMPAQRCAESGDGLAAGVLLVALIDALARLRYGANDGVSQRFQRFLREYVPSLSSRDLPKRFYDEFRNGLVHQGMIKMGSQFGLGLGRTVQADCYLIVDPAELERELSTALGSFIAALTADIRLRTRVSLLLRRDFQEVE